MHRWINSPRLRCNLPGTGATPRHAERTSRIGDRMRIFYPNIGQEVPPAFASLRR